MFPIIGRAGQRSHCRLQIYKCRMQAATLLRKNDRLREISYFTDSPIAALFQSAIGNSKLAMKITSRDNSLLRHARAVRDGKVDDSIFVEGLRLCEEALSSGLEIEAVIYSEELKRKDRAALLIEQLAAVTEKHASVSERLLESISY